MKKILFIALVLVACEKPKGYRQEKDGYSIIEIDGCEYIEVSLNLGFDNGYYSLTHKGNCKNEIHKCK